MPFLFFLLLVLLIAQIGFWKTLAAVIGAVGMLILLVVAETSFALAWRWFRRPAVDRKRQ